MTIALARWSVEEYHQMIATGLLTERHKDKSQFFCCLFALSLAEVLLVAR